MNHYTFTRSVLLLGGMLVLGACGGGGSGNSPVDPGVPVPPANIADNNIGNRVIGHFQGTVVIVPSLTTINGNHKTQNIGSDQLDTLTVGGKALNLRPVNENGFITTKNIHSKDGKSYEIFIVSDLDFQNSRYGYIKNGNEDYIFSQGALTANMPTSGVVKYDGKAALVRRGEAGTGEADFTADFGAKTLTGIIKADDDIRFNPVNINATINGNAFSTASGGSVNSAGHFYGNNAREMGGIFSDTSQQLSGSFGAIRK